MLHRTVGRHIDFNKRICGNSPFSTDFFSQFVKAADNGFLQGRNARDTGFRLIGDACQYIEPVYFLRINHGAGSRFFAITQIDKRDNDRCRTYIDSQPVAVTGIIGDNIRFEAVRRKNVFFFRFRHFNCKNIAGTASHTSKTIPGANIFCRKKAFFGRRNLINGAA